jgi:paraquat-inducible protein A
MMEVCLFAALVAIVKLSGFLQVTPEPGIWAVGGLTLLIPLLTGSDVYCLWGLLNEPEETSA